MQCSHSDQRCSFLEPPIHPHLAGPGPDTDLGAHLHLAVSPQVAVEHHQIRLPGSSRDWQIDEHSPVLSSDKFPQLTSDVRHWQSEPD